MFCEKEFEPIRGDGRKYGEIQANLIKTCKECCKKSLHLLKFNKYLIDGNRVTIFFNKGGATVVDLVDWKKLKPFTWYKGDEGYVKTTKRVNRSQVRHVLYLHTAIMGKKKGFIIDHIDNNKLNNTRKNLRFLTQSQNIMRCKGRTPNGHKGVYFIKERKKWRSEIKLNGRNVVLGYSSNLKDAVLKRKDAEKKYCVKHPGFSF